MVRPQIRLPIFVLALVGSAAFAESAPQAERFAPVAGLAGRCWVGHMPEGQGTDVQCFEWAVANRFLRNRHRLTGPNGVYQGETLYGWDAQTEQLRFWYFNSLGGVSEGTVERQGDRWLFREKYRGKTSDMALLSEFSRPDAKSYAVKTTVLRGDDWQPFSSIRFEASKTSPAEMAEVWKEADRASARGKEGHEPDTHEPDAEQR